ncbi:MAG: hypothetical protein J6J31_06020 [Thermoguttaceae bacterium]|nr:hypothetical protein [Thermoguttaceae bacterium]
MKYLLFLCVFLFCGSSLPAAEIVTADDLGVGRLKINRGKVALYANLAGCDELIEAGRHLSILPDHLLDKTPQPEDIYLFAKKGMIASIESFSEDILVREYIRHLFLEDIAALDEFKKAHPDFDLNCENGVAWYLVLNLKRHLSYLWLLENGADPNVIVGGLTVNDHYGERALRILVVEDVCNQEEYLLPLLQYHPHLKGYVNDMGQTLFHQICRQNSHLIPALILMGYDKKLLEHRDCYGLTPLASAVYHGQYYAAIQFLWQGADRSCLFEKYPKFWMGKRTPMEFLEEKYKSDSEYLAAPDRPLGQFAQAQMPVELEQMRNLIEYIRLLEKQEK